MCEIGYAQYELGCISCNCNINGSILNACDPLSGQCSCKEGVSGLKCDICEDNYYGLTHDGCKGKDFKLINLVLYKFYSDNIKCSVAFANFHVFFYQRLFYLYYFSRWGTFYNDLATEFKYTFFIFIYIANVS